MKAIRHVGLDVHATSISVAVADGDGDGVRWIGKIDYAVGRVVKVLKKLGTQS